MENFKENKMGTMPVGKLLFSMSVPAMFSMLIQALYNIVDSIFVSRISESALTAVSLAFPVQNLMIAFAVGTSVGICSVISRKLGEKRNEEALKAAKTGYTIIIGLTILFVVLGFTIVKPFFSLYTNDKELVELGTSYLSICLIVSGGCFILTFCEKVLQGTGDTFHPMIIQTSGAVFNIIFDPIFIFGLFGIPAMGIAGAAIATVAGQVLSMVLGIIFVKRNQYVSLSFIKPEFYKESVSDIVRVGLPSVIMQGIGTIMTSLMNAILIGFDILAATVFGVYFKLQSFVFLPVFGINQGLMPILGYNYGAKNRVRMMKALKLGVESALCIMILGFVVFQIFPKNLLGFFNASEGMIKIGVPALRKMSLAFPIAAISVSIGSLFQAMGNGKLSMITSIVRQLVFLIPLSWILGRIGGLDSLWYAFVLSDFFAAMLTLVFCKRELGKLTF